MANNKWLKLDCDNANFRDEPWGLYWNEMKSGTPEFEEFLHEPIATLVETVDGVDKSFTVQTNIMNHENGLMSTAVCQLALVDPAKKLVYLTLYKH